MGGFGKIISLVNLTNNKDAATKSFADPKLALSGGTMTGNLTMGSTVEVINPEAPTTAYLVCNNAYVDSHVGTKHSLTGGSVLGGISMIISAVIAQATAPITATTLCNRVSADSKLSLSGGTMTGNLTIG